MKVWIVEDQDYGDNAATIVKVFAELRVAKQWMIDHQSEAFGHYELAAPLSWDGTDEAACFEVER